MSGKDEAGTSGPNLIGMILDDKSVNDRVVQLRQSKGQYAGTLEQTDLESLDVDVSLFSSRLFTHVNGSVELPEQKGTVEYLRSDQRLLLPAALGMSHELRGASMCEGNPKLRDRYLRAANLTFAEVCILMDGSPKFAEVRAAVDELNPALLTARKVDWTTEAWYVEQSGLNVDPGRASIIMAMFSRMLQFNCDIRDYGFLNSVGATMADGEWRNVPTMEKTRLDNKLQPFTLQCIASLNYVPVASFGLSAWVRAFGVSMGILPAVGTRFTSELAFTVKMPLSDSTKQVVAFEQKHYRDLFAVCANVIAMFGLLHLNKDHTFRTGDTNMDRIGTSYINAVRTATNQELIDLMNANKESIIRTASHPFGLGQTYCVAQLMYRHDLLAMPLAIRHDVCPPPVQRILIAEATRKEWGALPAGADLAAAFIDELSIISNEADLVRSKGPSYSGLHALYGIDRQDMVSPQASDAVASVIPAIVGYVKATHSEEEGKIDGLGLAQIEREMKGLVSIWTNAWDKYFNNVR